MPVHAGARQDLGDLGRGSGQAQGTAEQPGPASAAHQGRQAVDVRMLYRGQVDDQVAGGAEQTEDLLAQGGS